MINSVIVRLFLLHLGLSCLLLMRQPLFWWASGARRGPAGGVGPPAGGTWCLTPRNPLFFRRQAPRLWRPRRRRRTGRGASLPASPCSFVVKHHVFRAQGAGSVSDVVLRPTQTLVPSSSSTTSSGPKAPPAYRTWCSAPSNPLFFRRQAPRLWRRMSRPPASHPKVMHEPLFFCSMHQLHFPC